MSHEKSGSIFWAMIWMAVLSCLLFWLPVAGPLVAGFVGGKKAGGVGAGIIAVLLPAVLFGTLFFFLAASLTGIPLLGFIAGLGGVALGLHHAGMLLVGAIIGGAMA